MIGLIVAGANLGPRLAAAQFAPRPFDLDTRQVESCEALSRLVLPELVGIQAAWVAAELDPSLGPVIGSDDAETPVPPPAAHCRVRAVIEPTIQIEVWLPREQAWNGRFLGVGGSGYAGTLSYPRMTEGLNAGYAVASTDTGHSADDTAWLGDPGQLRDFGYRAIFEMTAKARVILATFFGRPADYRYFNGCSLGGRQGLMEAERFPEDYDGIVAGAPVNAFVATRAMQAWAMQVTHPGAGQSLLGDDALNLAANAVIAQCDAVDGVVDGVLEDPRRCNFDPARLQCGVAAGNRCLNAPQVEALRQIHAGFTNPSAGQQLTGFALGSEPEWDFARNAELNPLTLAFFRTAVSKNPFWNWRDFDVITDVAAATENVGWILDATMTDLSEFRDNGGKLIVYHGWNDSNNSPEATIRWYEGVESTLGGAFGNTAGAIEDFARLFMVPGMAHCGGGSGTSQFDAQRAIEDWVERGIAPDRIEAERIEDGKVVRTRPLCPYPQVASYRNGNSDRSGSFICR